MIAIIIKNPTIYSEREGETKTLKEKERVQGNN